MNEWSGRNRRISHVQKNSNPNLACYVKVSASNVGDPGSIPGLGRSPGEGNGNSLQYSCLENPRDGEAWWAAVCGVAQSWTRLKQLSSSSSSSGSDGKESAGNAGEPNSVPGLGRSPGEGNDNPLQYSCLENYMDREVWQATVHEVAKSWTWLSEQQRLFWMFLFVESTILCLA